MSFTDEILKIKQLNFEPAKYENLTHRIDANYLEIHQKNSKFVLKIFPLKF